MTTEIKPNQPDKVIFWGGSFVKVSELAKELGITKEELSNSSL
jgi:hypothetical protein